MPAANKPKIFYGYWILVVAFLSLFVFSGVGFYGFSLFVTSLQDELGWSRSQIMLAWTVSFLTMGVVSPFVGRLVDRYGAKKVIAIGSVIGGLGFVILSLMSHLWLFYVGWGIVSLGMAAMGTVSNSAVVSRWFKKKRGLAIGIVSTGVGVGGFALAPLVGGYLIPTFGWRPAYLVMAAFMWVLVPLALLVIKEKPADLGLYPDGAAAPPNDIDQIVTLKSAASGLPLKLAVATSAFWLMAISYCTNGLCQGGISQNQVPYLEDIGFPVVAAVTALGVVGLGSGIGKFVFGWLCDVMPARIACAIGLVFQASGLIALMSVTPASPLALIFIYATLFGLGIGNWLPTMSILTGQCFGMASYGAVFGALNFAQYLGSASGGFPAAFIHDTLGSYRWAFIIFLIAYAIGTAAILLVRRPKSA